jgi:hypothetical protein
MFHKRPFLTGLLAISPALVAFIGPSQAVGITIADPSTWPEQAGLAAAGRWSELEVLQEELKGGRRV